MIRHFVSAIALLLDANRTREAISKFARISIFLPYAVPAVVAELEQGSGTQFGAAEAEAAIEVLRKLPGIIG